MSTRKYSQTCFSDHLYKKKHVPKGRIFVSLDKLFLIETCIRPVYKGHPKTTYM